MLTVPTLSPSKQIITPLERRSISNKRAQLREKANSIRVKAHNRLNPERLASELRLLELMEKSIINIVRLVSRIGPSPSSKRAAARMIAVLQEAFNE